MAGISVEEAMFLWNNVLTHDDGVVATGGEFAQLIGDFGTGKSTLIMQSAQYARHVDYGVKKRAYFADPEKYNIYPETVVMRGLKYDHWNSLLPKNWNKSFPNYGTPKKVYLHTPINEKIDFIERKAKRRHKLDKRQIGYRSIPDLLNNIKHGAINVVYEPANVTLSDHYLQRLRAYKMKPLASDKSKDADILVPSAVFWYEFIDFLMEYNDAEFITLIMDEFHNVCPANSSGDLYHMTAFFVDSLIHLRKNNISLEYSTHDASLIDYRVFNRIQHCVYFKGANPIRRSMVYRRAINNLEGQGWAIIEKIGNSFGKFPFDEIQHQPPVIQAVRA